MTESDDVKKPEKGVSKGLLIALAIAFLITAGLVAFLTYNAVHDFTVSFEMANLPGIAIKETTPQPGTSEPGTENELQVPLQPDSGPVPPAWDGAKRVTILVMGLDYRDWEAGNGPPRTDTMVLLTVDPLTRTTGMLSIPRDLWVNIPGGFNYGRINTAYQLGETYKYPEGGGPGLAMATVEELLGVPIDYYAQVDFQAFEDLINTIGGIDIDVAKKIKVDPLGDNNNRTIKKGLQHLNGKLALAYARTRHTEGGDFDRAARTQQVIEAVRNKITSTDMLPTLIAKSGILYNQLSSGVHTNLSLEEAIRLAWLVVQIPSENNKKGVIGPPDQIQLVTSPDGTQQVLKPITDKIRLLRDEIFTNTGPASPAAANLDPLGLAKEEAARISILNGSTTAGLASETTDLLKSQGLNITQTGNADVATPYTEIVFYTGKPYTVKYLTDLMKIDGIRIFYVNNPASPVDVIVTLGDDWVANKPK